MRREDLPENTPIRQIRDWPSFFEQIRRRPGMWLGRPSLKALHFLLLGIDLAESLYDVPETDRLGGFPFPEFEKWADKRFNPRRLSIRSFGMARRMAGSDKAAFDLWLRWYDEFRGEHRT
jgi:hypothetical protein